MCIRDSPSPGSLDADDRRPKPDLCPFSPGCRDEILVCRCGVREAAVLFEECRFDVDAFVRDGSCQVEGCAACRHGGKTFPNVLRVEDRNSHALCPEPFGGGLC